jgi:acylphosphatase
MSRTRYRVFYSGHVQGVGFRDASRRLARGHAVTGYVRNLPDGRVELVAEGDGAEVDGFLEAVRLRMHDTIRDVQVVAEPPEGPEFGEFSIRY